MGDTMSRKPLADESRHRITVSTFVLDDASKSWVHTGVQDLVSSSGPSLLRQLLGYPIEADEPVTSIRCFTWPL